MTITVNCAIGDGINQWPMIVNNSQANLREEFVYNIDGSSAAIRLESDRKTNMTVRFQLRRFQADCWQSRFTFRLDSTDQLIRNRIFRKSNHMAFQYQM
jgi:hypothetical protein